MVATAVVLGGGKFATSAIVTAIKGIYGIAVEINDFIDKHIDEMKVSENPTIARTGRVLDAAKYGFGLGYASSVIIISVGQLLLGNTLAAATSVVAAATLTNPIAMTCAAFGAIYYGWNALSDVERNEILEKISNGLNVGIELIKSILRFIREKTDELLDSKNMQELKKYIAETAAVFGKSLYSVTHQIVDMAATAINAVAEKSGAAFKKTKDAVADAGHTIVDAAGKAKEGVHEALEKANQK